MEGSFIIFVLIILLGFVVLGYLLRRWIKESSTNSSSEQFIGQFLKSFDVRSHEQTKEIREQTKALNERLDNAARVIAAVQKNIGEFSEIGRSMRDLQEFLRSPKLRGNLGEEVLADLIGQMFPKGSFFLQYVFKSGVRVDAAIKTTAGILPIDAKFPMENYQKMVNGETESERVSAKRELVRDVKKHIEDISSKYIVPDEGTLDFALMYVPSESVYYELVQITELMTYARRKMVYPVSPTTLYAHLQTILLSFAGREMETKSRELFRLIRAINQDFEKLEAGMNLLGKHLANAYNQLSPVTLLLGVVGRKLRVSEQLKQEETEQTSLNT